MSTPRDASGIGETEVVVDLGVGAGIELREGRIESLPVVADSADVVVANCVINPSPDKPRMFREAFRVLKPGGRLAISDVCLSEPLPSDLAHLAGAYVACVAGAVVESEYVAAIRAAGFTDVELVSLEAPELIESLLNDSALRPAIQAIGIDRIRRAAASVRSVSVRARKPRA
jgi:arsenite methyltransferase